MSLYLKYRPQDFSNLVGQGFIKDTLQKAIEEDKTVGAYLLTGPRGTGKTSTARIFAKAINCLTPKSGNPCLTCEVCTNFQDNKLIDIIEIDAASHTGVDNIREIIEKAQFRPTKTKYKIYIIDEVHMLSKGAFNALLKILEEPPEHVKFILATTEIHKVPETILSRCQRYDFKSISSEDIRERLQHIAKNEKVTIDEESLSYIIKVSSGGLRNAISLFEQLIVGNVISYENIQKTLGVSKVEEVEQFAHKLIKKDISLVEDFQGLESSGKNVKLFFRDVLLFLGEYAKQQIQGGENIQEIIYALDILHDTYGKTKNSFDEYLTFRIGIMKVLSSYTEIVQTVSPVVTPKQEKTGEIVEEKRDSQKPETPKPEESLFDDAQNIFSMDEPAFDQEQAASDSQPSFQASEEIQDGFDKNTFIEEVKKIGAKAAITMSLRGADFKLQGNELHILCKTKIALSSIKDPENTDFLHKALQNLGKENITLKLS